MKKKVQSYTFPVFGSILSLFILVFCTACASFDSYLETALNFYDAHQTELQAAQVALQEFTDSNECFILNLVFGFKIQRSRVAGNGALPPEQGHNALLSAREKAKRIQKNRCSYQALT